MISRDVAEDQTSNFTNALSTQVDSALPTDVPASQTQGVVSGVLPAFSRGECPKVLTLKPVSTSGIHWGSFLLPQSVEVTRKTPWER